MATWSAWLPYTLDDDDLRGVHHHHVRADLTDDACEVVPQRQVEHHLAVHPPEEAQIGHADLGRGLGLLLAADRGHLRPRDREIEAARLAVGDEAVAHRHPGVGEVGDRAGRTEVDVVGMGLDDQGTGDLVGAQHAYQRTGGLPCRHDRPRRDR